MLSFILGLPGLIGHAAVQTFWSIAESGLVLVCLAIAGIVLRLSTILPFLPAQYRGFAIPVSYLCFAVLFFNLGHRLADEHAAASRLQFDLTFAESQLANAKATAAQAENLADELRGSIEINKQKVADYETRLAAEQFKDKAPGAVCDDRVSRSESDFLRELANGRRKSQRSRLSFIDRLRKLGRKR